MIKMIVESILFRLRIQQIMPFFPAGGVLVDIGCGKSGEFIQQMRSRMEFCIGIDAETNPQKQPGLEIKQVFLQKEIPVGTEVANVVTMLAVLEHLDYPKAIAQELYRILKPSGVLLLTVPAPKNKRFLELLASVGILRKEMIQQHKHYFSPNELQLLFTSIGFRTVEVSQFQFGLNILVRAIK
jgi:2-polyprenyl-3-methyl-5-hydroxy-6-metoxy-1,4-benzoquinol methylase